MPDGVSSIALLSEDNPEITALITEDFFSLEVPPPLQHRVATVIWRDASGRTLESFPEGPTL